MPQGHRKVMHSEILSAHDLGELITDADGPVLIHRNKELSDKWHYGRCIEPGCSYWLPVGYENDGGFTAVSNALLEHWLDSNVDHHVNAKADLIVKAETRLRWCKQGRCSPSQPNSPTGTNPQVQQRLSFQRERDPLPSDLREFVLAIFQNMVLKKGRPAELCRLARSAASQSIDEGWFRRRGLEVDSIYVIVVESEGPCH